MSDLSIEDVILVVVSRLKQSEDSLEVFKAVLNLSISSKACKNLFNDKLLIEYSYKYVKDRIQSVIHKLKFFIRNNDFEGFSTLADLFVDRYSRLESLRALNKLLIYVTEHGNAHFMQSYLSYFFDRGLHRGSIIAFRRETRRVLRTHPMAVFPDFRPNILINALKMANRNHWEDKALLLVCRIFTFCDIDTTKRIMEQITATLKQKKIVNYDFASYLMRLYHKKTRLVGSYKSLLQAMTTEHDTMDENSIVKVTKELLQRPIEQQPWFFGNVKRCDIHEKYDKLGMRTRDVFLVTFYGSRLMYHQPIWKRQIYNNRGIRELPRYGLLNTDEVKDWNLYQFYLRLAAQDLEGMKHLQNTHGFNWPSILNKDDMRPNTHICTNSQPQPLIEYLTVVDDIRQDIVDWLFELCPCRSSVQFDWERDEISDQQLPIVRRIVQQGGRISSNLLLKYIAKLMPTNAKDFKTLMTQWDDVERIPIWNFVLDQYRGLCKQRRVITDTKMAILLAWKHADGESIGFRDLPRDLIRVIVDLIDEPPLVLSLAKSVDERFARFYTNRCAVRSTSWFKDNTWAIEFFTTSRLGWDVYLKVSKEVTELNYSIFRTHKKWIMLLAKHNARFALKFLKFMFKYEKDWQELAKLWSLIQPERTGDYERRRVLSIETLKARNKISLNLLVDFAGFIMPTKEEFQQAIKPKHNLTYEKMIQFVRENSMFKC